MYQYCIFVHHVFNIINYKSVRKCQRLTVICLLEGSFELLLSCFAAEGIDGSGTTLAPDLQQDAIGFTVTIF